MYSKHRAGSSWWVALWIYVVTFFLVTLTFFQAANAGEVATGGTDKVKKEVTPKGSDKSNPKKGKTMLVALETNQGTIKIKLNADKAPKSVENFVQYVQDGFYNGTIFHRVIKGFMIQGGGFTSDLSQKTTRSPIKNEANNGLMNKRGTVAMARTMDPHSATAQFFINHADNGFLDFRSEDIRGWGYAVFGEVIEGMDVVDKIAAGSTTNKNGYDDVPVSTIEIKTAKMVEK